MQWFPEDREKVAHMVRRGKDNAYIRSYIGMSDKEINWIRKAVARKDVGNKLLTDWKTPEREDRWVEKVRQADQLFSKKLADYVDRHGFTP